MKNITKTLFALSCVALLAGCQWQDKGKEISDDDAREVAKRIIARSEEESFETDVDFVVDVKLGISAKKAEGIYEIQNSEGTMEFSLDDLIGHQNVASTYSLTGSSEGLEPKEDEVDNLYIFFDNFEDKTLFVNADAQALTYRTNELSGKTQLDYFKDNVAGWLFFFPCPWNYKTLKEIAGIDEDDSSSAETTSEEESVQEHHVYSTGEGNLRIEINDNGEKGNAQEGIIEYDGYRISYFKIALAGNPFAGASEDIDTNEYLTLEATYSYRDVSIEKPNLENYTKK
jgi:hypothetical protein